MFRNIYYIYLDLNQEVSASHNLYPSNFASPFYQPLANSYGFKVAKSSNVYKQKSHIDIFGGVYREKEISKND